MKVIVLALALVFVSNLSVDALAAAKPGKGGKQVVNRKDVGRKIFTHGSKTEVF